MMGIVVSNLRKIYVKLSEKDYSIAVKAYADKLSVLVTVYLMKEGRKLWLKNPQNFAIDEAWTDSSDSSPL